MRLNTLNRSEYPHETVVFENYSGRVVGKIRVFKLGGPCIIFSRRALRAQDDRKTTTTRLSRGRTLCVSVINYEDVSYRFSDKWRIKRL